MEHAFSRGPPHLVDGRPSLWRSPLGTSPKSVRFVEHWVDDRPESATAHSDLGRLLSWRCTLGALFECDCHRELSKIQASSLNELTQIVNSTNSSGPLSKCDLSIRHRPILVFILLTWERQTLYMQLNRCLSTGSRVVYHFIINTHIVRCIFVLQLYHQTDESSSLLPHWIQQLTRHRMIQMVVALN